MKISMVFMQRHFGKQPPPPKPAAKPRRAQSQPVPITTYKPMRPVSRFEDQPAQTPVEKLEDTANAAPVEKPHKSCEDTAAEPSACSQLTQLQQHGDDHDSGSEPTFGCPIPFGPPTLYEDEWQLIMHTGEYMQQLSNSLR